MSNEGDRASVFRTTKVRTKLRGDGSWLQHRDEPEPEPQEEEKPWLEEVRARRLNGAPIETSPVSSPVKSTPPPVTSDTESKPATPGYLIRGVFTKLEARPSSPSSPYNGSSKPTVFTKKPSEAYKKIAPHIVRNTSESPEGQLSPEEQEKRTMVATSVLKTKSARRSYVLSAAKIYDSKETPSDTPLVSSNPSFVAKRVEIADDGEIAVTPTPASTVAPSPAVPPTSAAPAPAAEPRTEVNTTVELSDEAAASPPVNPSSAGAAAEPVKEEPLPQSVAAKEQLQDEKTKSNDPTVAGSVKVAPTEPQLQAETPMVKVLPPLKTSPAQKSAGSESPAPAYTVPRPVPAPRLAPFTATPYSRTPVPTKTLREITVKTEPEPEPQHEAEAAPEEEAESGPQPTEEQEPVLQDEAESEPEPEPTEEQEPELEDEAESEPEPTEEQEPELEDEAESETEPTEEQEPELEDEAESESTKEQEPELEDEAESETEPTEEQEPELEDEAESESTKEQEPELEDDSDSDSEIKAESLLPLGCPVIDPPQRVIKVVPHPVADVIPYTDSYRSEESELAEEEGGSAESPTPEDSVEEEPAPALEDGEPTTGDLLGFSDGPEEEPAEPVPPSPGRWSQDLLSGLGSESSPAKTSGTLDLLAHDVVVANTEARSSADPFDPYPIGSASHNSPSDLLEPVADVSINSLTTPEEEEEEKSLDSEVNSPSSDLSSRPWTVTWEVPQLTNTEESQEAETEDQAADQRTVIMFEKKSTESSSPWDRWTSPTVYTVSTTTKEGDEEEEEEKVEEEESPEDTEKVTVITTVREVLNEPEPAVDRLASYSSAVVEEERRVPTPEPETKKPFVYVKEYVNAAEMSSLNPRDTFHRSDDFASSYSYSYNSPSSYIRVTESSSCTYCGKQVGNNAKITIEHLNIDCHPECFKCDMCSRPMGDLLHNMFLHNKKVHCESCYAAVI
ncbi:zinc finger protein 185 isoform X2 [Fundulus heteroclitus]|uniref:zinc finger protein 185 isoform X2 n=1 Tax=Fundulus heteroclitus TaxID=8078 RepID=UPI00165CAB96|nr:zinc finger protein 185 isoform X2 [Fundulus heteroclitus]